MQYDRCVEVHFDGALCTLRTTLAIHDMVDKV